MKSKQTAPAFDTEACNEFELLAENMLRDTSKRSTKARIRVLALLLGAKQALSHQDVQSALPEMDRVTLYRTLDNLTEIGLAHKIAGDDRVFRYSNGSEHASQGKSHSNHQQHGHFKCTRCARVFCLDPQHDAEHEEHPVPSLSVQLQATLQNTLGRGFQSHDIELTIKGWCADCSS